MPFPADRELMSAPPVEAWPGPVEAAARGEPAAGGRPPWASPLRLLLSGSLPPVALPRVVLPPAVLTSIGPSSDSSAPLSSSPSCTASPAPGAGDDAAGDREPERPRPLSPPTASSADSASAGAPAAPAWSAPLAAVVLRVRVRRLGAAPGSASSGPSEPVEAAVAVEAPAAAAERDPVSLGSAGPSTSMPVAFRMAVIRSAFFARVPGLAPRALAMAMSSSRSLASNTERSSCGSLIYYLVKSVPRWEWSGSRMGSFRVGGTGSARTHSPLASSGGDRQVRTEAGLWVTVPGGPVGAPSVAEPTTTT